MSYQPPPEPDLDPIQKMTAREFITNPLVIFMGVVLALGIWFGSSFINNALNPTPENSTNYYGVAKVTEVVSLPAKCFLYIERENGRVTKQPMAQAVCGKVDAGDMINIENGQYVSHAEPQY